MAHYLGSLSVPPAVAVVALGVVADVFVDWHMHWVWLGDRYRDMLLYVHRVRPFYGVWYRLLYRDRDGDRLFHRDSHCLDDRNEHWLRYLDVNRDRLGHRDGDRHGMRHSDVLHDWHGHSVGDLHRLRNGHAVVVALFVRAVAGDNSAPVLFLV